MADATAPSPGDGDGTTVGDFIDGMSIRWQALLGSIVGASVLAYFQGVVSTILGLFDIPIALLSGLANFGGRVVTVVAGLPAVIVERGFAAAVPFVVDAGPAGFAAALGIVLVTLYIVEGVINRVRG
jgi:hypothetical protein